MVGGGRRRAMSWSTVGKSAQAAAAHALLLSFTFLLVLKIDRRVTYSWMCRALMPGDEESMTDEAIWETLP